MTKIEWTDDTINFLAGCSRASAGCDHCYSATMTKRLAAMGQSDYAGLINEGKSHFNGMVRTRPDRLAIPLKWKKPKRVFVNSMSDTWHPEVPFEFIAAMFGVMAATPHITYQLLTKRPEQMLAWFDWVAEAGQSRGPGDYTLAAQIWNVCKACAHSISGHAVPGGDVTWPLPNVWLGVSCENQDAANERIPQLLRCPAAVRFVSAEPLLGPIDLYKTSVDWAQDVVKGPDWLIVGGESGPSARPCDVDWTRSLVSQCSDADVACFLKQLGANPIEWNQDLDDGEGLHERVHLSDRKGGDPAEWPEELRVRQYPGAELVGA